jgi:diguanylate cyclase (GGDEF)-like protein
MEKIRKNLEKTEFNCDGTKLKITVSIGIAQYTEKVLSIDTLLDEADKKLYIAKKTGKNKVIV